jgi:hypothetical protein
MLMMYSKGVGITSKKSLRQSISSIRKTTRKRVSIGLFAKGWLPITSAYTLAFTNFDIEDPIVKAISSTQNEKKEFCSNFMFWNVALDSDSKI